MKKYIFYSAVSIFILPFLGCSIFSLIPYGQWKNQNSANNNPDVYISGVYISSGNYYPCYWENGNRTDLEIESSSIGNQASSIFIDGNDVYCGGIYLNPSSTANACYWKNGKLVKLSVSNTNNYSLVTSIYVTGGIVFCCGYEVISGNFIACYWINNNKYSLISPNWL